MILVVNADDAGIDPARNRGILEAARRGVVRSASVLVGFPAAAALAREAAGALGLGLHLNLTEGTPLVAGHRTLAGADGRFHGKRELWRRARAGALDLREAGREIEAQWEALRRLAGEPTHLDGHNHVHLFPGVAEAVAAAIGAGTWVRRPMPRPGRLPEDLYADLEEGLGRLSARVGAIWGRRFRHVDRFVGPDLPEGYGSADLVGVLAGEHGTVEVMTHPGATDPGSVPFSARPERAAEVAALCDRRLLDWVRAEDVQLSSFGDLA